MPQAAVVGGDQAQLDAHCRDDNPLANLPLGDRTIVCGDWVAAGPNLTHPALGDRAGQYVVQLARAPANSSTLWAATRFGRLFVSRNAAAPDAASVTLGTDFGVERLPAGATAWERVDANLPPSAVYGLSLAPSARKLYGAPHGRGIFSLKLH